MLEKLLHHKCESAELQWLDMYINLKRSCCIRIGPRAEIVCSDLTNLTCISGASLTWVNEVRYLGIYIVKSRVFTCSSEFAKRSFTLFCACNDTLVLFIRKLLYCLVCIDL